MISVEEYFGPWLEHPDATPERKQNAQNLLVSVNGLLVEAEADGVVLRKNPATQSLVSGVTYGGFRPQECPQGAPKSSHKDARGVDAFDPDDALDNWISKFDSNDGFKNSMLEKHGLYRENPSATSHWCHLTDKAPKSGRRSFYP